MDGLGPDRLDRTHTVSIIAGGGVTLLTLVVALLFTRFIPSIGSGIVAGLITVYLGYQQEDTNKIAAVTAFIIVVILLLSAITTWLTVPSLSGGSLPGLREIGTAAFALGALLFGGVGRWVGNRD